MKERWKDGKNEKSSFADSYKSNQKRTSNVSNRSSSFPSNAVRSSSSDASARYSLPCAYCPNQSFANSDLLKQHLLSSHNDLVSKPKKYIRNVSEDKNVRKSYRTTSSSSSSSDIKDYLSNNKYTQRTRSESVSQTQSPSNSSLFQNQNLFTSSPVKNNYQQSTPVNSPNPGNLSFMQNVATSSPSATEYTTHATQEYSERKINRMIDTISEKDQQIENLSREVDNLKLEITAKDEDQDRLRQRWRKEAEDAIRNLKTNYEDIKAQKQLLERQLNESENEKLRVRNDNDKILKDHFDLQTQIASDKRTQLQRSKSEEEINRHLGKEKEITKSLSGDLKNLRHENETLAESVSLKEDMIKKLQQQVSEAQKDLKEERKKRDEIEIDRMSLKGKLAVLEASIVQNRSDHSLYTVNVDNLTSKIQKLETNKMELMKQISSHNQVILVLNNEIKTLKDDKQKLVDNLQNADSMLSKLSTQVSTTSLNNDQSMRPVINGEVGGHLEMILSTVKQISSRENLSNSKSSELQKIHLLLVDEKATVKELHTKIMELEDCIKSLEERNGDSETYLSQLQTLRSKHQKCIANEKARKMLKSEKKKLMRQYQEVQKELQLVTVQYESSQEELKHTVDILKDVQKEKSDLFIENKKLLEQFESQLKNISERDVVLEKYKRESCYLLEKLNTATEELTKVKNTNELLGQKLTDFSLVRSDIESLQANVHKLNDSVNDAEASNISNIEALLNKNVKLTNQVIEELQEKLSDSDSVINLQQKIQHFQTEDSKNRRDSKVIADYECKLENLNLEKEILSSRVLILEGIREEMEQIRKENYLLKEECKRLRLKLQNQPVLSRHDSIREDGLSFCSNDHVISQEYITEQHDTSLDFKDNDKQDNSNDFVDNVKTLDQLDDSDKIKLQEMLSMPEFQKFLSSDVVIDLRDSSTASSGSHDEVVRNLSSEVFEQEHTVDVIHAANNDGPSLHVLNTGEFVQGVYEKDDQEVTDITVDHSQERNDVDCEHIYDETNDKDLEAIVSESKLISDHIARQNQGGGVNYKEVLQELGKVFGQVSSHTVDAEKRRSSKQVKFSDHLVEVAAEKNNKEKASDSAFYKSFLQDAMAQNYPQLSADNDNDIRQESSTTSRNSSSNIVPNSSFLASNTNMASSNENSRSPSLSLREQSLQFIKSNPRAITPPYDAIENLQRLSSSPVIQDTPITETSDPNVSKSPDSNNRRRLTGDLTKLPQIAESDGGNTSTSTDSNNTHSIEVNESATALNVLRTFIDRAENIPRPTTESLPNDDDKNTTPPTPMSVETTPPRQYRTSLISPRGRDMYNLPIYALDDQPGVIQRNRSASSPTAQNVSPNRNYEFNISEARVRNMSLFANP